MGTRRHERIRRLCLRLWRRRGLPPSERWLSEEDAAALAENALRSCGTLHEDELAAMFRWADEVRCAAVMLEETIRGRFAINPRGGEPKFGLPPKGGEPEPPRKRGRHKKLDAAAQETLRQIFDADPCLSSARAAEAFADETGISLHRNSVQNYREQFGFARADPRGGPRRKPI